MNCWNCKAKFEAPRKGKERKWCPSCGRNWRAPNLYQRFREAWTAFKCEPAGVVKHRKQYSIEDCVKEAGRVASKIINNLKENNEND